VRFPEADHVKHPDVPIFQLEVKGIKYESDKAKAQTTRDLWVPGVTALGGFGRWAFAEVPRLGRDGRGLRLTGQAVDGG
jgi:hypothetical protein